MRFNNNLFAFLFAITLMFVSAQAGFAQDSIKADDAMNKDVMKKADAMKKDGMMKEDAMMDDKRPIVAIIAADWCPYCKKVDPVVAALRKDYSERLNFVVLDVTNATKTAAAKAEAEKLGISDFFAENKSKTSTVAILKDAKVVYKTSNNGKKDDYVKAFDKALQ